MMIIVEGFLIGIAAGILMGFVSDVCYRLKIFKSSLVLIDAASLFRTLKIDPPLLLQYIAGTIIHLVTSGVFGGVYMFVTSFFNLNSCSVMLISIYCFVLWISMLFIALPIAGQGFLGRKAGPLTWLEQLILHIVFGAGYYGVLLVTFSS